MDSEENNNLKDEIIVKDENREENVNSEIVVNENNLEYAETTVLENNNDKENIKNIRSNSVEGNTKLNEKKSTGSNENEKDYIEMVFALESEKQNLIEETKAKINHFKKELEELRIENERLKKKNTQLEQNLVQKEAVGSNGTDGIKTKQDQNDILIKAKTLLFEKTKVCKQQEQHIEVLKNQVDSIKEVLAVTKDMLNLRNTENEHLQSRLDTIDLRFKAEKDRQSLLEKKLDISKNMYDQLRKEYDYQSNLHKEIKAVYEQKVNILDNELKRLKNAEPQK